MRPILAGIDSEYGLSVEGRGAESQIEDAKALVRDYPGECFVHWDYRFESPRADLRGFNLDHLAVDPVDAQFDVGKSYGDPSDVRSDRILPNGARFYNDHGHPEYATPECLTLSDIKNHDLAGQTAVLRAGKAFSERTGLSVRLYKNNTDYHGASYGTHEGYLVPRELGFDRLFPDVLPMLIARQVLTGAGKVGSESGPSAQFQLSQRADFFVESANAETLYRRPIFNTRDEAHADPSQWIRLHVISGDANMIASATARKVGLVKLALALCENGTAPIWRVDDPVRAFQNISRDMQFDFRVELRGGSWTTVYEILESYFSAGEKTLELDDDLRWTIDTSRQILTQLRDDFGSFRREVDWAAKYWMLQSVVQDECLSWSDPSLRAYDLEFHNVDPSDSLHEALVQMGEVSSEAIDPDLYLNRPPQDTRAFARGLAVSKFAKHLKYASWSGLVFGYNDQLHEIYLPPECVYPMQLAEVDDVGTFIEILRGVK